ncbi:MAG: carboxypeptidase M32 [Clostridia bacterium]|nr:carboxypeptidase M32 [Clostridia bacterium]
MTVREALENLEALEAKMYAHRHAMSLMYYDAMTTAPTGGSEARGRALKELSREDRDALIDDRVRETLMTLDAARGEINEKAARQTQMLLEKLQDAERVPADEAARAVTIRNRAETVWHEAKVKSDFEMFAPHLEQLLEIEKRLALYRRPDKDPYETCLDRYEKELDISQLEAFFAALRSELVPLIRAVGEKPLPKDITGDFPVAGQRLLTDRLMALMGLDRRYCSVGETEHPFTDGFNKWDVRITTHYHEDAVLSSLYSVVHEGGHALYELGVDDDLQFTCLAGGTSMSIHESQSRFYENILGRSRGFLSLVDGMLRDIFPEEMKKYTEEDVYRAANRSLPSLIRTQADELTYALHVMIRFELEKRLFDGSLRVKDLPGEWNRMYREVLGVKVPCDREGVLQDSHWSGAMFGYFPSYALGSAYGAQMLHAMKKTVDVDACVSRGDLAPVTAWLKARVHRFGRLKKPAEVLNSAFDGESFSAGYYVGYLKDKYTALYGL